MGIAWLSRGARSAERARRRMFLTGVTPNGHPLWDQFEVGNMVEYHPDYRLLAPLLPRRTLPAQYGKAGRLGLTKPRREWDENEIPRLRRMYPGGSQEELLAAFPGRTWLAIAAAARKRGVYRKRRSYKSAGVAVVDAILERAHSLNLSLADLDAAGRRPGYFTHRKWNGKVIDLRAIALAVDALGGRVRAKWDVLPHADPGP